ncbi:MAG: thioredoxin domain-containing protein [Acidobacteriota bacterium]|nr:thioredoxin domain-containing protein [Acidobacteriota bacterium]MDQ5871123.1 thioredoxin domain-containing protein [Acidobacteriota bacterium]
MKNRLSSFGILAAVLLLFGARTGAEQTLRFAIIGIDCKECAPPIVKALREVPGVKSATLDWKKGVATVDVADGFDRTRIKKAIDAIGYDAVFAGENRKEFAALPADVVRKLDIVSFDGAKKVDLKAIAVPGKITVVDYWAEWCSPCHFLEKRLHHLLSSDPKMALRRVNVGEWDNAAARQATAEFRLEALPYVRVYDSRGKFVADVTGGSWDQFLKVLEKARARG